MRAQNRVATLRTTLLAALLTATLAGCASEVPAGGDPGPDGVGWTLELGASLRSAPTTDGTTVFVGDEAGALHAVDLSTGRKRWTASAKGALRAAPVVAAGSVLVVGDDGYLRAFAVTNGEERWAVDVGNATARRAALDVTTSAPVVTDGVVHVGGAQGKVHAVDALSGEVLWAAPTAAAVRSTPAVVDGVVVVGSNDHRVHAFDAETGEPVWHTQTAGAVTSPATAAGDVVLLSGRDGRLVAYAAADGDVRWSYGFQGWADGGATVVEDVVVAAGGEPGTVVALDLGTGEERWATEVGGSMWGAPAVADGVVHVGSVYLDHAQAGPTLHRLDLATGDIRGQESTGEGVEMTSGGKPGSGVASQPLVTDELVVVGGLDGVLRAFER